MIHYPKLPNPFPSLYEEVIYKSRYAKWLETEKRREEWPETVARLIDYYQKRSGISDEICVELFISIHNLEVMPSMRSLMASGPAMDQNDVCAYNCAYLPVDSPRSFDEAMLILLNGTGVGFSVENKYIDKLPKVAEEFAQSETTVRVGDSKEGWAKAVREFISLLFAGQIPRWDTSAVRPAGARLKTFGGRASGPEPLEDFFKHAVDLFRRAAGRRLTSIECHDLMCMIADVVVVGGVRRSAMISLSDVTDDRMRAAKMGDWWNASGHRALSNNSAVYENRKPDMDLFMKEWKALYESKSGERGIFSRYAAQRIASRNGRRNSEVDFGTNPCSEIILRPFEFCNLTEVVVRSDDTRDSLERKVRIATILGTVQSTFTDFKYLRKIWRDNCEEERLLGVSFTGVCDNLELLNNEENLNELRDLAVETNREWAERLGINPSAAITCVKPSGTVSQLVDSASGLHTRYSDFYIRTIRADNKDPLTAFLKAQGVPNEPELRKPEATTVFSFPIKSPKNSLKREEQTAIEALELWKTIQENWCEHKPSCTVYVREEEWMDVGAWCYRNFDLLSGVSFLPYDGGIYRQAPYQPCSEEEYEAARMQMPKELDWSKLRDFEQEDNTTGSQELACSGGVCEITDVGRTVQDG